MKYVRILGRWYVSPAERHGVQPDDRGRLTLTFEHALPGSTVRVNGGSRVLMDGCVTLPSITVRNGMTVEVVLPNGEAERAEPLTWKDNRIVPEVMDGDAFLLELGQRVQWLEQRMDEEETKVRKMTDKSRGALFLGGTKQ